VIDARPLAANVTIDANELSRIFTFAATTGDFTLGGLTLTGGRTIGNNVNFFDTTFSGGAIRSLTTGNLTLDQSTVSGNSTEGTGAHGGGIFSNGTATLTESTVSGNSTAGYVAPGGGIMSRVAVTLTESTVSGNSTAGDSAMGGGIGSFFGSVTLTQSTVSGNSTAGDSARGGGIYSFYGSVTLIQSTVTDNHALAATAMGGGVFQFNSSSNHPFSISDSIVAGNTAGGGGADLVPDPQSTLSVNYSLIGVADGLTFAGNVGNLTGSAASPLDPQLDPLGDNGGPTETHALLAGSPAIDMGDPTATPGMADVPLFDQRGNNFGRVQNGRIDIGAFEVPSTASADFDSDGFITGLDFLLWQIGVGTPAPDAVKTDGDADNDLDADGSDLGVWETQYGLPAPLSAAQTYEELRAVQAQPVSAQQIERPFWLSALSLPSSPELTSNRSVVTAQEPSVSERELDQAFSELSAARSTSTAHFGASFDEGSIVRAEEADVALHLTWDELYEEFEATSFN
jgi:hypothetical protein